LFAELISKKTRVRVYLGPMDQNPVEGVISGYNPMKEIIKLNDDKLVFPIHHVAKIAIYDEVEPGISMRCPAED
jgi:hypothetical protein